MDMYRELTKEQLNELQRVADQDFENEQAYEDAQDRMYIDMDNIEEFDG